MRLEPLSAWDAWVAMYTAAQLRLLARDHLQPARMAAQPAQCGMLRLMALEFERDARVADREERREALRQRLAEAPHSLPASLAA